MYRARTLIVVSPTKRRRPQFVEKQYLVRHGEALLADNRNHTVIAAGGQDC